MSVMVHFLRKFLNHKSPHVARLKKKKKRTNKNCKSTKWQILLKYNWNKPIQVPWAAVLINLGGTIGQNPWTSRHYKHILSID